jgi:5-methylthioribose kinase
VRELGGGVSNAVLLAESTTGSIVIKQSLEKLRVAQDWFADPERIHRECDAIRMLGPLLPQGAIPRIVFEDRDNCIYAMTAASEPALPWKSILMERGIADPEVVAQAGALLGRMIEVTRGARNFAERFGDREVFTQLRLDPYYRSTAARHPDLAGFFDELIAETLHRQYSLVHGDWSPKNLLVSPPSQVIAIDFEVVHYGDPAFDVAFLLNHLVLKSLYLNQPALWRSALNFFDAVARIVSEAWLERAVVRHLGALLLARVDGKSPAEYIQGTPLEPRVRAIARDIVLRQPASIVATMERLG